MSNRNNILAELRKIEPVGWIGCRISLHDSQGKEGWNDRLIECYLVGEWAQLKYVFVLQTEDRFQWRVNPFPGWKEAGWRMVTLQPDGKINPGNRSKLKECGLTNVEVVHNAWTDTFEIKLPGQD